MSYVVFVKTGSAICLCSLILVVNIVFVKTDSATCCLCSLVLVLHVVIVKTHNAISCLCSPNY